MKELRPDRENIRLDRFLLNTYAWLTQGVICAALRKKHIRVNNKPAKHNQRVTPLDVIQVEHHVVGQPVEQPHRSPQNAPTKKQMDVWQQCLLEETQHYCVLNKPIGLAMQGGSGVCHSLDDVLSSFKPRYHLVHRLDRDTSGICIVAKNADAAVTLGNLFKNRAIRKTYRCIVQGVPAELEGVIRTPVDELEALTRYKVLARNDNVAWVECHPHSGRKHQIRQHMKDIGTPIVGDQKYNRRAKAKEMMQLHAFSLGLPELWGSPPIVFEAPYPPSMYDALKKQGWR